MDPCAALAEFDPLDRAIRRDPFPFFAGLRDRCPVGWSGRWGGFWVISRFDDIMAIHRDHDTFRSGGGVMIPPLGYGGRLIPMSPTHPGAPRSAELCTLFGPRHVATLEPVAPAVVREALDGSCGPPEGTSAAWPSRSPCA